MQHSHFMTFHRLTRILLYHLGVVALMGFVLRLKMLVPIPWLNQKYLLNGHNHFAFIGWISLAIMVLIVKNIHKDDEIPAQVNNFFRTYIFNSWAMLLSFLLTGYGWLSMMLLCAHIILSIWFARYWFCCQKATESSVGRTFISLGQAFNLLSFLGPLLLIYLSRTGQGGLYERQNSLYVFLHFQYNGYFIFSCLGLLFLNFVQGKSEAVGRIGLWFYSAGVTIGLSLLLLVRNKPAELIFANYFSAILLLVGVVLIIPYIYKVRFSEQFNDPWYLKVLPGLAFAGFVLKSLLQSLSAIPAVGYMVYEHRSIAIGYLHLVFLVIVSFFLLYMLLKHVELSAFIKVAVFIAVSGTLLNELFLSLQGLGAIIGMPFAWTHLSLMVAVGMMALGFLGIALFARSSWKVVA